MDATTSALLGTVIGGGIGIIGTVITVIASGRLEEKKYRRAKAQELAERIRSAYEFSLNVLFNMERSGAPDRATYGDVFAKISLYGAPEVRAVLDRYVKGEVSRGTLNLQEVIQAMQAHLTAIEADD